MALYFHYQTKYKFDVKILKRRKEQDLAGLGGYMYYSRHVLKGGLSSKSLLKITWNHFQTLRWQAQAAAGWAVVRQIPSGYKIVGILKEKQAMIQWPHQECMFFASTDLGWIWIMKSPTWWGIKSRFLLWARAHAAWWSGLEEQKRPEQALFQISLKFTPAFPSSLQARTDVHLEGTLLGAPENSHC